MNIEVLYFDGCPNHEALLPRLRELLTSAGVDTAVELRRVEDGEAAEQERFLGSPTVRINGEDVDLSASERTDFGLKCRLFATPEGLRGMPADECVLAALERAREGALGLQRSRSPDAELPLPEGGLTSPESFASARAAPDESAVGVRASVGASPRRRAVRAL